MKSSSDSVRTCKNTLNTLNTRALINIKYQPGLSGYINHAVATQGIKRMEEERETYIRLDFISLIAVLWGGLTLLWRAKQWIISYGSFVWRACEISKQGKNSSERRDKAKRLSARRIREEGSGWEGVRPNESKSEREEKRENKAAKQYWSSASRLCGLCVPGFRKRSTPRKGTNTTRAL